MKFFLGRNATHILICITLALGCKSTSLLAQEPPAPLSKEQELEILKSSPDFTPNDPAYVDLLIMSADTKKDESLSSLLALVDEIHTISLDIKYKKGECSALILYGYYYFVKGQKEKGRDYWSKALALANKFDLKNEKLKILNNMGIDFWTEGNHAKALAIFLEALNLAKEVKDPYHLSLLNNNISLLYMEHKDYKTALSFLKKARQISEKQKETSTEAISLLNMAVSYFELDSLYTADKYADKALEMFSAKKLDIWIANSYQIKGGIQLKFKNYKKSLEWYRKSEKLCDKLDYVYGYDKTYLGLAASYAGLNRTDEAVTYALKALAISTELDLIETRKEANIMLANLYAHMGDHSTAYTYQEAYVKDFEKISKEDFKKGLGVLKSEMQFENQKKELIEQNRKKVEEQKNYLYIATGCILFLAIVLALIYRFIKVQQRFTIALQKREKELQEANETKNKLFSVIAHDLRGPINSFYSLMKLYQDDGFSKEESKFIFPKALQEIQSISQMLNNLLSWAKAQMGGNKLKRTSTPLFPLAQESIQLLQPIADKKKISLNNEIDESVSGYMDRNFIDVVFRNLISNAIKFSTEGGQIVLTCKAQEDFIELAVKDTGVGMEKATLKTLFVKNMTHSTHGTNQEKGTGLGLLLCKDMVEANGGRIWVESIKDEGSTFFFTVPASLKSE